MRVAEVNRSLVKEISGNLLTRDSDGAFGNGFLGNVSRGRNLGTITDRPAPTAVFPGETVARPYNPGNWSAYRIDSPWHQLYLYQSIGPGFARCSRTSVRHRRDGCS